SVTSTASPLAAAASAAIPPVTTSGLAGRGGGWPPSPPSDADDSGGPLGSGASGTSAETLTHRSSQRSARSRRRRAGREGNAVKPRIQRVQTHWNPGFIASGGTSLGVSERGDRENQSLNAGMVLRARGGWGNGPGRGGCGFRRLPR